MEMKWLWPQCGGGGVFAPDWKTLQVDYPETWLNYRFDGVNIGDRATSMASNPHKPGTLPLSFQMLGHYKGI